MSMMRSTKTPFQYMKQFKAVAADWEYFASLSDEGQLYCLSDQQIYVLLVQLEYVGWLTRWYNTDDITQTTVDRVKSDLMEALMSCVDVSILVDQANENLITQVTNRAIQSQLLRDALAEEYTGDPTSINPAAPTTDFGSSGDRYDALCAGLMAFVYQFARAQADSVRAGQIGGLAAISLIAALLIPGLNIFFLVGASIAVLLGLGTVGVTTEVAIQALTDTDALDAVVCCMRENLKDAAVSEANWLTALGGCDFEVGSREQIVADFLTPMLSDNYLTILNILGQAYTGVINGEQLPECPCFVPPPDPNCIDLTEEEELWAGEAGTVWTLGEGFVPDYNVGFNQTLLRALRGASSGTIEKVIFTLTEVPELIYIQSGDGSGYMPISTGLSTEIEFSAATLPGTWYNRNASLGLRVGTNQTGDFESSMRLIEACIYFV